jgi:hypothetical protein
MELTLLVGLGRNLKKIVNNLSLQVIIIFILLTKELQYPNKVGRLLEQVIKFFYFFYLVFFVFSFCPFSFLFFNSNLIYLLK